MKKPKPIKVNGPGKITLQLYPTELPYIYVDTSSGYHYGFIEDRDVKRIHKWCEHILKRKGKKS